jgi:hypothetical protein
MTVAQSAKQAGVASMNEIRELVAMTLKWLGFDNAKPLGERLICDGHHVGVQIAYAGVSAIWLDNCRHVRFIDGVMANC